MRVKYLESQSEITNQLKIQHLVIKLEEYKYIYFIITKCESTTVQDIFWARSESIKFLNTFMTVLIMDSSYKTNLYKM